MQDIIDKLEPSSLKDGNTLVDILKFPLISAKFPKTLSDYSLNETIAGVIDEYYNMIEEDILECDTALKKDGLDTMLVTLGYFMCLFDQERFKLIADRVLPNNEIKRFLVDWNELLRSDLIFKLKEEKPFKYIFKGNICFPPDGRKQEKVAVKEAQDILFKRFLQTLKELDKDEVVFKSLTQVFAFFGKIEEKISKLFSTTLTIKNLDAFYSRLLTINKNELGNLQFTFLPGQDDPYSMQLFKFILHSQDTNTVKQYAPMNSIVTYACEAKCNKKCLVWGAQEFLKELLCQSYQQRKEAYLSSLH